MFKHMIFDLDGTIVDTVPDLAFNLNTTFKELNLRGDFSHEEVTTFLGSGKDEQIRRALRARNYGEDKFSAVNKLLTHYYAINVDVYTKPFENVVKTLEALKKRGITLYVATNKPENVALIVANKFFANLFTIVRGDKGDGIVKPHASFLNSILSSIKSDQDKVLFIGDSYVDYLTGKGAGLPVALVKHGYDPSVFNKISSDTIILSSFEQLLNYV